MSDTNPEDTGDALTRRTALKGIGSATGLAGSLIATGATTGSVAGQNLPYSGGGGGGSSGGGEDGGPEFNDCEDVKMGRLPIDVKVCVEWRSDGVYVKIHSPDLPQDNGGRWHLTTDNASYHANDLFPVSPSKVEVDLDADFNDRELDVKLKYCAASPFGRDVGCVTYKNSF